MNNSFSRKCVDLFNSLLKNKSTVRKSSEQVKKSLKKTIDNKYDPSGIVFCIGCGQRLKGENSTECHKCGKPTEWYLYIGPDQTLQCCLVCRGSSNPVGARFCSRCGDELESQKIVPQMKQCHVGHFYDSSTNFECPICKIEKSNFENILTHKIRELNNNVLKDAMTPLLMFHGAHRLTTLLNANKNWNIDQNNFEFLSGNEIHAWLVGMRLAQKKFSACLIFYDGEKDHGVTFEKISGSPSRIYYSDPYGNKSYLATGDNLMNITAQSELDGSYSISNFEFERLIAGIVVVN